MTSDRPTPQNSRPRNLESVRFTIPCPDCATAGRGEILLVLRTNRHTGKPFLGCPEWPQCNHTQPVPESVLMVLAGQPRLFD